MKKNYFVLLNSILLIVLAFSIYKVYNPVNFGELYKPRFGIIDKSVKTITENMELITNSTADEKWTEFKKLNKAEESQITGYNMLVKDIKNCYLQVIDLDDEKVDNIKILDFRNKSRISNKNYKDIADNNSCLDNFKKYDSYQFSENDDLNYKLQNQIKLILDVKELETTKNKFNDILIRESDIIHSVANLSTWLKIEYDTYK